MLSESWGYSNNAVCCGKNAADSYFVIPPPHWYDGFPSPSLSGGLLTRVVRVRRLTGTTDFPVRRCLSVCRRLSSVTAASLVRRTSQSFEMPAESKSLKSVDPRELPKDS